MSQVVQAKCPRCQNVLRIPADWVYQPMRCKHCQQIFQAKQQPGAGAAPSPAKTPMPVKVPPAAIAPLPAVPPPRPVAPRAPAAKAPPAAPLAIKAGGPPKAAPLALPVGALRRQPYRRRRGFLKGLVLAVGVLGIAGVLGAVVGPKIARQFSGTSTSPAAKDDTKVADIGKLPLQSIDDDRSTKDPKKVDIRVKEKDNVPPPKVDTTPPKKDDTPPKKVATPPKKDDTPPKKVDTPKKDDTPPKKVDTPKKDDTEPKPGPVVRGEAFPRRALFISVNDYLLANPLQFGLSAPGQQLPKGKPQPPANGFPGSSTWAVHDLFSRLPLRFPESQMVHLSDAGPKPHAPVKVVMERTITDFLATSRAQDRIVLLFAGHATEDDKEAYLVPLDGDLNTPKSLIPLTWLYDRLKECKARQKVLILDVCRFDPARGNERPGGDPMGKLLDDKLKSPPEGVQILSSCVADQQSHEFEGGSVFLQAICASLPVLREQGIQEAGAPIPVEDIQELTAAYMTTKLAPHKLRQTARLTGKEKPGGAPPNPEEPGAAIVKILPPASTGGTADPALVEAILLELNQIPPTRISRNGAKDQKLNKGQLPPFSAKTLEEYKADYESFNDLVIDREKYPLRLAVLNAAKALRDTATKFSMREAIFGDTNNVLKTQIKNEQAAPGKAELHLKEALEELKKAGEKRDQDKSKRWQAHYDYVLARLLARLVYVTEYNYALAQIRTDSLPEKTEGVAGFRLGSSKKVNVTEGFAKDWAKEMKRTWDKIINDYPETPWAVVAQRERLTVLGLEWRVARK